jgi:hypothetical protein
MVPIQQLFGMLLRSEISNLRVLSWEKSKSRAHIDTIGSLQPPRPPVLAVIDEYATTALVIARPCRCAGVDQRLPLQPVPSEPVHMRENQRVSSGCV